VTLACGFVVVELRGFEPLTPCMPCSFSAVGSPRSEAVSQLNDPIGFTVTVRWIPLVPAAYGTQVARPARTTSFGRGGDGSQLVPRVTPVLGDAPPRGQEPGRLTAARWGDSNSTAPAFSIRDQGAVSPATCGSCDRLLTARARCCPRFADRPRTQHGPAPVRGGRLSVLWSWTPWARRSSATSSGAGRSVSRRLASPPLLPACSDRSRAVHMSRSTACTRPLRCNLNNARLSGWQSTWQSA
jgi:hypothetical protein